MTTVKNSRWRRSSHCIADQCVEVAATVGGALVRDGKAPGRVLMVSGLGMRQFVGFARR